MCFVCQRKVGGDTVGGGGGGDMVAGGKRLGYIRDLTVQAFPEEIMSREVELG